MVRQIKFDLTYRYTLSNKRETNQSRPAYSKGIDRSVNRTRQTEERDLRLSSGVCDYIIYDLPYQMAEKINRRKRSRL